ncbi:MAG: hypothetical protein HYY45_15410 [Deltaproteobacteria bacterium]|nr:hypothetical protein [Deltaproteobacteria bacterium]
MENRRESVPSERLLHIYRTMVRLRAFDEKLIELGAEIAATVAEKGFPALKAPIQRVCYPDRIVPGTVYGESLFMIEVKNIVDGVQKAMPATMSHDGGRLPTN